MCKYYDDMYKRTQCPYYKDAGEICRGNNSIVNGAIKTGIRASWTYGKTSASESEILNTIRKSLISGDQDFRSFNKVPYNSCLNGNAIDLYHDLAFEEAKISTVFYGGNLWPQSVWPNVVPFDPRNKSKYDIRRLFNK